MTRQRPMYPCEWCGAEYVSPLAAALCCDETMNELDTVD